VNRPSPAVKPKFPWLSLLIFVGLIYAFWILPAQLGPRDIRFVHEPVTAGR